MGFMFFLLFAAALAFGPRHGWPPSGIIPRRMLIVSTMLATHCPLSRLAGGGGGAKVGLCMERSQHPRQLRAAGRAHVAPQRSAHRRPTMLAYALRKVGAVGI